jgi:hypothetical protein
MSVADSRFDKLDPGATISATVEVYIRQKPGFCMDQDDLSTAMLYQVKPLRSCYSDPYSLVNSKESEDVPQPSTRATRSAKVVTRSRLILLAKCTRVKSSSTQYA